MEMVLDHHQPCPFILFCKGGIQMVLQRNDLSAGVEWNPARPQMLYGTNTAKGEGIIHPLSFISSYLAQILKITDSKA